MNRLFGLSAAAVLAAVFSLADAKPGAAVSPVIDVQVTSADTTFDRDTTWTIDKSVSPEELTIEDGDSDTADYTVTVTKTETDSNWKVSGQFTITRSPNGGPIALGSAGGLIPGGTITIGSCSNNGGTVNFEEDDVKSNDPWTCNYVSSVLPNNSSGSVSITVDEPNANEEASLAFDFSTDSDINETGPGSIDVTDSQSIQSDSTAPWVFFDSGDEQYTATFECPDDAGLNDNTATITQTQVSDVATVDVTCLAPPPLEVTKELILGPDGSVPEDPDFGTIDIGVNVTQIFTYKITISAIDAALAEGAVVFDHVGAEYNLNCGDASDPLYAEDCDLGPTALAITVNGECMVATRRPDSAYKLDNIPEKQPEFIIIEVGDLSLSGDECTVEVDVMTDENPGGGESPDFEPTGCLAFTDESNVLIRDDADNIIFDWIVLNPGVEAFDPSDGHLLFGPVAGLKLEPVNCPAPADLNNNDIPDVLE